MPEPSDHPTANSSRGSRRSGSGGYAHPRQFARLHDEEDAEATAPEDTSPAPVDRTRNSSRLTPEEWKQSKGELTDLYKTQPMYAMRIQAMDLDDPQRDMVAYVVKKSSNYMTKGGQWKTLGDMLYATQMAASAVVPVLIGILGSFDSAVIDLVIRVCAIVLSVAATICATLESVYSYRLRGQVRRGFGDQLNDLFQSFDTLSGRYFDPAGHGAAAPPPPTGSAAGSFVMPDLSQIPRSVLKAQIAHLVSRRTPKPSPAQRQIHLSPRARRTSSTLLPPSAASPASPPRRSCRRGHRAAHTATCSRSLPPKPSRSTRRRDSATQRSSGRP
jgi:hypothetical protein